jgi:type I site-specific restriction endonuclease
MPFRQNKQKTAILMKKAFETIKQLAADFKAQEAAYLSSSYQESQVRQDFIDKFFAALGWDVTHERQPNRLEMLCQSLDHQIDEAAYELYGLTPEKIAIVEGKSS